MRFNKGFEKAAFIGPLAALAARGVAGVAGGAARGVGKALFGSPMRALNTVATGAGMVSDASNFSKRLKDAGRDL